jgi:hypothetical protein
MVTQEMVGHKLGEFAQTRKRFKYRYVLLRKKEPPLLCMADILNAGPPRISRVFRTPCSCTLSFYTNSESRCALRLKNLLKVSTFNLGFHTIII